MCLSALIAAGLGVAGNVASGLIGANASNKAAGAQTQAANSSLGLQREGLNFAKAQWATARTDALPWMNAGKTALNQYQIELGQKKGASKFRTTPGYAFQVSEGEKGVVNNLSALGMKDSGSALKALTRFRTGLADQHYDSYLNRLSGMVGAGQNAVQDTSALGAQATNAVQQGLSGMGQTMQDAGAARASGYVGSANAYQSALGGGINSVTNALGRFSYGQYPAAGGLY